MYKDYVKEVVLLELQDCVNILLENLEAAAYE